MDNIWLIIISFILGYIIGNCRNKIEGLRHNRRNRYNPNNRNNKPRQNNRPFRRRNLMNNRRRAQRTGRHHWERP